MNTVTTITDLRLITGTFGDLIKVLSYYSIGDNSGGPNRIWVSGLVGTFIDNGGSVIVPINGDGSGAWVFTSVNRYSVKEFGAKGDGLTDDSFAIDAARMAAKVDKKALYFPAGTYLFSENTLRSTPTGFGLYFSNSDGQEVYGDGVGRTVLKNISTTGALLRFVSGYVNVHSIQLDNGASSGNALSIYGQFSRVDNIFISGQGAGGYALVIDGASISALSNIQIVNTSGGGLALGQTLPTNYVTLNSIAIGAAPSGGETMVYCKTGSNIRFSGLTIEPEGNFTRLLEITDSVSTSINNFTFENMYETSPSENEFIKINNSKSTSFSNGYLNQHGGISKTFFGYYSSNGLSFSDIYYRNNSQTLMVLFESVLNTSTNVMIKNINTFLGVPITGVKNTAAIINSTIENWYDINYSSSFILDSLNLAVRNVAGDINLTSRPKQVLENCSGVITGTGEATAFFIN